MPNAYLERLREQHASIREQVRGLMDAAAAHKPEGWTEGQPVGRDLDEAELTQVRELTEKAEKLAGQITPLVEAEARHRAVEQAAAALDLGDEDGEPAGERLTGNARTQQRDPGHYRAENKGGKHSFFRDLVHAREGDGEAAQRLAEHSRALSSSSAGTGILPPKWMVDEYVAVARQGRVVSNRVRHIPLGSDPRPITLPKQVGADVVTTQASENATTTWTDAFTTNVDTVTPAAILGGQEVSRQLVDGATPAVDLLIYGDLMAAYNSKIETLVCSTMATAAGTAVAAYATEAAYTTAVTGTSSGVPFAKDLRKTATSVRNLRKLPANMIVAAVSRYGSWLDITDAQGRPLFPVAENNPMNALGQGSAQVDGRFQGLDIYATDGLPYQTYPESILVARAEDTILFEGDMQRFRYEQPKGPETIRLGVWAYAGAITRYAGASVQRLQVTGA